MMVGVSGMILTIMAFLTESWQEYTKCIFVLMTVSTVLICLMPESNKWLQARHIQKEASNGKIESIKYFMKSREIIKTTALLSFIFSASQMSLFGLTLSVDSRGHQTSRFVQNQFSN